MTTFQKITSAVAGISLLAGVMLTLPTQAATSYVQGHDFLQGHSASGGANFLKDFMGYYSSSDSVRLFSDEAIRNIFKNDSNAGYGYVSSLVVVNPSNANMVYFTTNQQGLKDQDGLPLARFRVNGYDFSAKKMTILYTKDYPDQGGIAGYDLIGSEGNWLVMQERSDNSPGPCANQYTALHYVKMDIMKPSAGLMSYAFPKELVDEAEAESVACANKIMPLSVDIQKLGDSAYSQNSTVSFSFTSDDLVARSAECGTNFSKAHFDSVLSKFASVDQPQPIQYKFVYQKPVQSGTETYSILLVPNTPKYADLGAFKKDFDLCATGGADDFYPFLQSENYLIFTSGCGSGFSDGSGKPNGCMLMKDMLEPTIKLKS